MRFERQQDIERENKAMRAIAAKIQLAIQKARASRCGFLYTRYWLSRS